MHTIGAERIREVQPADRERIGERAGAVGGERIAHEAVVTGDHLGVMPLPAQDADGLVGGNDRSDGGVDRG